MLRNHSMGHFFFNSFEKFPETAQNYIRLDLLANFVPGFLGAGGLIPGKGFITVGMQSHGTVGQADQIHQPFDPFLTADPVFLHGPEGFPFIIRNLDVPPQAIPGQRQIKHIFCPIRTGCFISAVLPVKENGPRIGRA